MAPELLLSLAQERSSERRRELMGRIADLFFEGSERYSDRELVLFGEVLTTLLDQVSVADRAALSERLADSKTAPHPLVRRLASDEEIEVAHSVLTRSPVLTVDDLVWIACEKSSEHRLAISQRDQLAEPVTLALIEHGEAEVLRSVSSNGGAALSGRALEELTRHAASSEEIGIALLARADLAAEQAGRVFQLLPASAQRRLVDLSKKDPQEGGRLIARAERQTNLRRLGQTVSRVETKAIVTEIKSGARALDDAVAALARDDRFLDLGYVLAELSGLQEAVVSNILTRQEGTPLAVLGRALNLSMPAFRALVEVKQRRMDLPSSMIEEHLSEFDAADSETAARAIRFVKLRSSVKGSTAA